MNCGTDYIGLTFNTQNAFTGRIFVKGYAYQSECGKQGSGINQDTLTLTFNQCGVRRSRTVRIIRSESLYFVSQRIVQPTGIAISTTVIVSFHSLFLTKVDRAYRINCFYMEAAKTVTQVRVMANSAWALIKLAHPLDTRCVDADNTRSQPSSADACVPLRYSPRRTECKFGFIAFSTTFCIFRALLCASHA